MLAPAPKPPTVSRLWLPRLALSGCLRGVMGRDTRAAALTEAQQRNYFPATPLFNLCWWFTGGSWLLPFDDPAGERRALPGPLVLFGPQRGPTLSISPGPTHAFMLMMLPDALQRLTGIEPDRWVDRHADAHTVLPPDWLAMCEAVRLAPDDDARVRLIEGFLDARWQAARPPQASLVHHYHDWMQGLALRAATSAPGRSLRQVERRIKQWAGQSLRDLRGVARSEQAFIDVAANGPPNWAEVALRGGYADQSHLCRETRRVTGFSPAELYARVVDDEAFWSYRLWV